MRTPADWVEDPDFPIEAFPPTATVRAGCDTVRMESNAPAHHGVATVGSSPEAERYYAVVHAGSVIRYSPGKPAVSVEQAGYSVFWAEGSPHCADFDEATRAAEAWLASDDAPEPTVPVSPRVVHARHKALDTKW